jgi:hypothetical protein
LWFIFNALLGLLMLKRAGDQVFNGAGPANLIIRISTSNRCAATPCCGGNIRQARRCILSGHKAAWITKISAIFVSLVPSTASSTPGRIIFFWSKPRIGGDCDEEGAVFFSAMLPFLGNPLA